jgi:hypothetical protein
LTCIAFYSVNYLDGHVSSIRKDSDDEAEDNIMYKQPNGSSQRYEQNNDDEPRSFTVFAKPATIYKEIQSPVSTQNHDNARSKVTPTDHHRRHDRSTHMSSVRNQMNILII